jgi:hypothetical protein
MKFIVFLSLFFLSFTSSANVEVSDETKQDVVTEYSIGNDRGKKKRKAKRTNKRRKRKCQQFGRKSYAG